MCDFKINPPMLFAAPQPQASLPAQFMFAEVSVELFVPDLENFAVTDADLPAIQAALREALLSGTPGSAMAHC